MENEKIILERLKREALRSLDRSWNSPDMSQGHMKI